MKEEPEEVKEQTYNSTVFNEVDLIRFDWLRVGQKFWYNKHKCQKYKRYIRKGRPFNSHNLHKNGVLFIKESELVKIIEG